MTTQGPIGTQDADFSPKHFHEIYTANLVNTFANCASRTSSMMEKYFAGVMPAAETASMPISAVAGAPTWSVFADAALDQAVEGVVSGIWFNQGEVCCAGSRLFVEESIHDDFIERLKNRMKTLRVGNPLDKNTDVGAINSRAQLQTIERYIEAGTAEGAECFTVPCALPAKGFWCAPRMFTGVQPSHTIAREEIFGPVLSVMTFRTPDEAVQRANNTTYGLSAGVWTEKGARALEMANRLSAGVVWLNTFNRFDASAPFGGYRESGFGREGGRQGLLSYVSLGHGAASSMKAPSVVKSVKRSTSAKSVTAVKSASTAKRSTKNKGAKR